MASGLIAKKIGMSQIFDESGKAVPITILQAGPCKVVQVKTEEKDRYSSVQIGFEAVKESNLSKAEAGHLKKAGNDLFRHLAEFRDPSAEYTQGQEIGPDLFEVGQTVKITGVSKGKGFQGVIKRHGFKGGRATHGSKFHRAPGSLGSGTYPSEVKKGKRMTGHAGSKTVSITRAKIVAVDTANNLLMVRGGVPGANTSIVKIEAQ